MVFRAFCGFLAAFLFSVTSWAETIDVKQGHPEQYRVVKGDTLWGISGKFLNNPAKWPEVWKNNSQINNPDLIYPGDIVYFSMVNGKPVLGLSKYTSNGSQNGPNNFKPRIRETPIEDAINLIPIESIAPFLTSPRVVSKDELPDAPYIIQVVGEHLVAGAGDRIYARGIQASQNLVYTAFRPGITYQNPETKEILGYEAIYVATTTLQKNGDPATLLITESDREVRSGDRMLTAQKGEIALNYFPKAPDIEINGSIINVLNGVYEIGQYDVIVIDKGSDDGLASGNVLDIYQYHPLVKDPYASFSNDTVELPPEYAGTMMIFRTFERVSYGLVMSAVSAIHVLDKVVTP